MAVVDKEVASTTELVDAVLSVGRAHSDRPLWHRGHTCSRHSLIASLPRKVDSTEKLLTMEQRLITRFRQRSLPYWPAGYPQNDWEQLFAMQHYGLPTRLLDWSENLFVALYFASLDPSHVAEHDGATCHPVLWVLDPIGWNRGAKQLQGFEDVSILTTDAEDLKSYAPLNKDTDLGRRYSQPLAIYGSYNSVRITAQRGTFTVTGSALDPMEVFAAEHAEPTLWRFDLRLPRHELVSDLRTLGFAESMIFPDLAGVSREIALLEGLS
jgi:hypothetical protein